jgi:hypothetical protein
MKPTLSDKMLRNAVVKELEDDSEVAAKHISVTAIDGAITLGGHVMTYHEKHVAVRAAERISAVRAVADEIEVRESPLYTSVPTTKSRRRSRIYETGLQRATIRSGCKCVTGASSCTDRSSRQLSETPSKAQPVSSRACAPSTT